MACATPAEKLKVFRDNILDTMLKISVLTIGNNYTYSIEGQSVTVGVDTIPENMAKLQKLLQTTQDLLQMYEPFEIHSVVRD